MLSNIEIKKNILADEKYKYLFTVDEVNKMVMQGVPFRDAYKIVGKRLKKEHLLLPLGGGWEGAS
jgi:argininosuccinate lyase